jgi:hypothetical protein
MVCEAAALRQRNIQTGTETTAYPVTLLVVSDGECQFSPCPPIRHGLCHLATVWRGCWSRQFKAEEETLGLTVGTNTIWVAATPRNCSVRNGYCFTPALARVQIYVNQGQVVCRLLFICLCGYRSFGIHAGLFFALQIGVPTT